MQIVIDISDEEYEDVKKTGGCYYDFGKAIYYGTLLPKGHGRIVDIDKVLEEMRATRTYDIPFALERVKPLIEVDKAESEVNVC